MSPEQLAAWTKDKNASIACSTYRGLTGTVVINYVMLDKGIVVNGALSVDADCKVTIMNATPAKGASAP